MSTPTASNSQSTPQLDESIRISHLEPRLAPKRSSASSPSATGLRSPALAYPPPQNLYTRQSTLP